MKRIPELLKTYSWEIEFRNLDLRKHRIYIIRRILEYGDEKAVKWMWKNFRKSEIKSILMNFRGFSKKNVNFWSFISGLPRERRRCFEQTLTKRAKENLALLGNSKIL